MYYKPKISVIIPSYNGGKYIEKAILSFINQEYPEEKKELIIVDGKSTDNTHEIIRKYCNTHTNIKWLNIKDRGISHASNEGIKIASGDIIGRLGTDDMLYKDIFKEIAYADSWGNADVYFFNAYVIDVKKNLNRFFTCPTSEFTLSNLLLLGAIASGEDTYYKKNVLKENHFNENCRLTMDYEMALKLTYSNKWKFQYINVPGTIHLIDNNLSSLYGKEQFDEACEIVKKYTKNYNGQIYFKKETPKINTSSTKTNLKNKIKKIIKD